MDRQRTAVVTGASAGIGKAVAGALAGQGWHVIAHGRDPGRSAAAEADIRAAAAQGGRVDFLRADLSMMADAARMANDIAGLTDRVDILVNNAGCMATTLVLTPEGHEQNFAGNHLGPFVLTLRLLPLLRAAAADAPRGAVRIINTSSDASEMIADLNWDDIENRAAFSPSYAYCGSKLANVLFARGLARRLAGDGIIAHSMHPGTVSSNFFTHAAPETQAYIATLAHISPEEGADTIMWLALSDEGGQSSGGYWHQRAPRTPNPLIDDDAVVDRLWTESETLTGMVTAW